MKPKQKLKRLLKPILFILIASSITACTKHYVKPQLPENLRHCEPLKTFEGETFANVLLYTVALAHQYRDCDAKSEAKNSYFEAPQ